ncbi:hypothetical protein D9M71_224270 [compost metagenome]
MLWVTSTRANMRMVSDCPNRFSTKAWEPWFGVPNITKRPPGRATNSGHKVWSAANAARTSKPPMLWANNLTGWFGWTVSTFRTTSARPLPNAAMGWRQS